MGRFRLRWIGPLVAVALTAGAATGLAQLSDNFTNPAAPVPGKGLVTYLSMTGTTGKFTGGVTQGSHAGDISVLALDFGLATPIDPSTGQPTGRAACNGIDFRKPTDRATPLLFSAAAAGQNITSATFDEYQGGAQGIQTLALEIKVTNAIITSVHHVDGTTTGAYDDVTLKPGQVTMTWKPGNIKAQFSCSPPA
jgi:type VI secretion system secreted protein Hcp